MSLSCKAFIFGASIHAIMPFYLDGRSYEVDYFKEMGFQRM